MTNKLNSIFPKILDSLSQPLLMVDKSVNPSYCNSSFLKMIACNDDIIELQLKEIMPDISLDLIKKKSFSTILYSYDGSHFQINVNSDLIDNEFYLLKFKKFNITNDSLHSQRLETLGMLAGGVAHDFNNILAGILGHTAYLKNILPQSGDHLLSLNSIEEGSKKASLITQEILRYSKMKAAENNSCVVLSGLIDRTINLLKRALSPKSEIKFIEKTKDIKIFGSEVNICQVLINLIKNSHDALQDSSNKDKTIKVELGICKDSQRLVEIFGAEALLSEYAEISVIDSGVGMNKETLQRVFEPYFSTKAERGTGLGLATVAGIVKNHGGAIDIRSQLGKGTIVSVYLPLIFEAYQEKTSEEKEETKKKFKSANILIIDDEDVVRNVIALNLGQIGYTVETVASGVEGLEILKDNPNRFNLILLDMLMPKMSGEETFEKIRKINSNQNILIISGYCSQDTIDNLMSKGARGFLSKPFSIDELAKKVQENV